MIALHVPGDEIKYDEDRRVDVRAPVSAVIYVGCCSLHDVAGLVFCHGPMTKKHWAFDDFFVPRLPHCCALHAVED